LKSSGKALGAAFSSITAHTSEKRDIYRLGRDLSLNQIGSICVIFSVRK